MVPGWKALLRTSKPGLRPGQHRPTAWMAPRQAPRPIFIGDTAMRHCQSPGCQEKVPGHECFCPEHFRNLTLRERCFFYGLRYLRETGAIDYANFCHGIKKLVEGSELQKGQGSPKEG